MDRAVRVALYARYSSDQQRAASIDDQLRLCREYVARVGWQVTAEFTDAAISGASLMRPGIQALIEAGRRRAFDVVLAESLDRFSRDQEDTAGLFKRLSFAGVRIVTLSEGDIGHLHVGFKGTMNALYLHDLAEKTRRGLRGRVEAGKSGGGLCYGYRAVRVLEGQPRGDREVYEPEAAIVRRIFRAFVDGASHKAIAKQLNAERVAGPRGRSWSPSTIYGNPARGTGILNNELYVGTLVWNRLRYVKDPDTGNRLSRCNPPAAWITTDVPQLRIIDDELWQAVKDRQAAARRILTRANLRQLHRPKYLFSGLTKCGTCGGGFILSSHDHLICFNARNRGTCTNRRSIKRVEVETRILRAMRERLLDERRWQRVCDAYVRTMNRMRREQRAQQASAVRERSTVEKRIRHIVEAVSNGFRTDAMRDELIALEAKRAELAALVEQPKPATLHPRLAEHFRAKVEALCAGLTDDAQRDGARSALRGIVEAIIIPADPAAKLWLEGNLGAMLELAGGKMRKPEAAYVGNAGCGGTQPASPTFRLRVAA